LLWGEPGRRVGFFRGGMPTVSPQRAQRVPRTFGGFLGRNLDGAFPGMEWRMELRLRSSLLRGGKQIAAQ
jgi:hypothetical protein